MNQQDAQVIPTVTETKADRARAFLKENPNATASMVAEAAGFTPGSASVFLAKHRRKLNKSQTKKKPGRPPKNSANKPAEVVKVDSKEIQALKREIIELQETIEEVVSRSVNLMHQNIGYEAVISYLESKIEEKNGATV